MRRASLLLALAFLGPACANVAGGRAGPNALQTTSTSPSPTLSPSPTPRPNDTPRKVAFAAIADFGDGSDTQFALARRMCRWRERRPFGMVITAGDNIYPAGEPENFRPNFYEPYGCLLDAGVRFRAVLGNHDVGTDNGRPELDEPAFGMRGRSYVVRKRGVRFVLWESNYQDVSWLRRNLGEEPGDRWTVVSFHHPVFSPGPHGPTPGLRPLLPRLFRRKGVDLVINAHDHLYARMAAKRRVRYVVSGGGGAGVYNCERPATTEKCVERYHFLYVVAGAKEIRVRAVPIAGRPFDRFSTEGRP